MKKNRCVTNEELQHLISDRLRGFHKNADVQRIKTFYIGAKTLLNSVKIDIDSSKFTNGKLLERTKQFLQ